MELAAVFLAELRSAAPGTEATDAGLEARLDALVERGRAAHPKLALDGAAFVRHLARCLSRAGGDAPPALEELAIEDLYLACAALLNAPGAIVRFEARCRPRLRAVLGAATKSRDVRAEIEQRVRDLLLVGTAAASPRIVDYAGQGPLDRWVAVVAQRQVINLVRRDESEQRARDGVAKAAAVDGTAEPEILYAKRRYKAEFEQAMKDAIGALGEKDRMLLRLHLVSGLSVESIGKMYGVSQSTASRWLGGARDTIWGEVQRLLRERIHVSRAELASLAGLVASQIDVSMSRLLGGGPRSG